MNFTHRNKRTSFYIRDILRVSRNSAASSLVNQETSSAAPDPEETLLTGSSAFRTHAAASSSSHHLLTRRDDGLMMMISSSPSGDCFATGGGSGGAGTFSGSSSNSYPSLSAVEAYLTSVKIPSPRYLFPSLLPPSSAPSFDHHHPLHAHSSDPCVHHRLNSSSSTSSSSSSSATSLILPTAASVAATGSATTAGIANWSSPFSSAASGSAAAATCIPCFPSAASSGVVGMIPWSSPSSSHPGLPSAVLSGLDHHHSHLLLHRNHLDARNQQLAAGHVCRLDSPPASSFELMTVGDDDDDAGEGSGRDTHSEVGRDSISGSASPVVVIVSAGNNNSSSITDSRHHQIQWHRHHHRNHEQHFHAYPVKDHPTRGPDDDQEDAAGAATGVDSHDECNVRKIRRNRTVFTELQLMGLERRFDSQKYLSTPDRADLARVLGLTQLQVKTWYQVMQAGCLIPPTKPKGRPKKNSIPSLGIMDSLLFPT